MLETKSTGPLVVASLVIGLMGCVDAPGRFDEFSDRVGTVAPDDGEWHGTVQDISGRFLLSVDPKPLIPGSNPETFVQFLATFQLNAQADGSFTLDAKMVPVRTSDDTLVEEEALITNGMPVKSDGNFAGMFVGTLPWDANPISGTSGPIDSRLEGQMRATDFICGYLKGKVNGVTVDGSTFGGARVTSEDPATWPTTRPYECPR